MIPYVLLYVWSDARYTLDPYPGDYVWPFYCYTAGIFFYIGKVPERWSKTGRFDYFGASHQIFHVLVLLGIGLTIEANRKLYEDRLQFVCPENPPS